MCISNKQAFDIVVGLKKIYHQYGLGHLVLLVSYFFFLLAFASAFFIIESTNSNAYYSQWRASVALERQKFVTDDLLPEIFNNTRILVFIHDHKSQYLNKIMQHQLTYYENRIKLKPPMPILKCTFGNSFLFAFSTIMTIGYGSIYPVTFKGRIISILFSLMGIPYTIIVIKDLEYLLVKLLSYPCILFAQFWHMFRYCTLQTVTEDETESRLSTSKIKPRTDYRLSTAERLMLMPIMVAVFALIGWMSVGCLIGYFYMPHVNNHVIIYFIFNSLATIGVGDIDLGEQPLIIVYVLFIYILIGLAIVSLFINLLHTKFSRAYWLPGQMYLPLLPQPPGNLAKIDSFDEDPYQSYAEPPIYRYTTLGIFQAEDRCPLIHEIRKETAKMDASTQTQPADLIFYQRPHSPPRHLVKAPTTSRDDVNSLIVETYGSRPARMITPNNDKRPVSMY